jgi:tetratricopeptide (TPR) repeat protein
MRLLIASLVLLTALPASAGMRVVGNTLGEECYQDTLLAPNPRRNADALAVCDRAVVDTTVNAYNQAANHVNRAEIRLRMANFQGALDDAEAALAIHDGIGTAYLNRGAGLVGLGRHAQALPDFDKALALGVDRPQLAYFDRAIARENVGDIKGAYLDYKKASEIDPRLEIARAQLSRFTVR